MFNFLCFFILFFSNSHSLHFLKFFHFVSFFLDGFDDFLHLFGTLEIIFLCKLLFKLLKKLYFCFNVITSRQVIKGAFIIDGGQDAVVSVGSTIHHNLLQSYLVEEVM